MSTWEKFKDKLSNPIFHYGVGKRILIDLNFLLNKLIYFFIQAICSFTASAPDQLTLSLGDSVHVREECDGKS
jgi:hypothetical protein